MTQNKKLRLRAAAAMDGAPSGKIGLLRAATAPAAGLRAMHRTVAETAELLRGCAKWVWDDVGAGHREKPYQCALGLALDAVSELCGEPTRTRLEVPVAIKFMERVVGVGYADILFDNCVIEVKISDSGVHRTAKESHILQTQKYVDSLEATAGFLVVFYLRGVVVHQI